MTLHLWPVQQEFQQVTGPSIAEQIDRMPVIKPGKAFEVIPSIPDEEHPLSPALCEPLPEIEGGWGVIMADPAWKFRSWVANANPDSDRSAERHYRTMTLDEIKALPVKQVAAKNAHLFLWITMPFLMEGKEIMRAWGFKYSSSGFV